ncbi:DUF4346 domain-containing protein [Desulfosporosinus metallidurans]|uniref:N5-methyltetrahydromethanopterin:coenzyme M methyltransferase subunit A n=1 Tax=Desulfosporosinus metallidurans TaxID=1888891 RepID=A0A1Q8QRX9_9FIRM|nr:DUF4346 domain-containing protein [Desulfosporosinus metallidurans]OLN30115.1 N5-methyltetrahydromethanopterin:coenzyme M methyltransferase subunit A [Desulfosporosinus metallidurans]
MEDFNEMIKEIHQELDNVRQLKKCTACECFLDVIEGVKGDLEKIDTQDSKAAQEDMKHWLSAGNKERHACYGCEECLPISPYNRFSASLKGDGTSKVPNAETIETNSCGCGGACKPLTPQPKTIRKWPIIEGDYIVGNPEASIAICTLADIDLPNELKEVGLLEYAAIIGTLYTENLGIERVIRNLTANPNIGYLILCGKDSRGHRAGQAILSLKDNGLDLDNRIIGALGPRPVLKNITAGEIEAFRKHITVINEIGTQDTSRLTEVVKAYMDKPKGVAPILPPKVQMPKVVEAVPRSNREWTHDPEGFFLLLLDRDAKSIICEHYVEEGVINEVIKGVSAEDITNTVIKRGLLSRLDHAAYLGRELAKAETALNLGIPYTQDETLI